MKTGSLALAMVAMMSAGLLPDWAQAAPRLDEGGGRTGLNGLAVMLVEAISAGLGSRG